MIQARALFLVQSWKHDIGCNLCKLCQPRLLFPSRSLLSRLTDRHICLKSCVSNIIESGKGVVWRVIVVVYNIWPSSMNGLIMQRILKNTNKSPRITCTFSLRFEKDKKRFESKICSDSRLHLLSHALIQITRLEEDY